ncbi:transposase, partial [Vagococcus acidifermentans]
MKRRSYSKEFKRQAVLLVLNEGNPPQTVAKQLDVHVNSLYRW